MCCVGAIVILNTVVYVKTKHYARPDRTVTVAFLNGHQPGNLDGDEEGQEQTAIHLEQTNTAASTNNSNGNQQGKIDPAPQTPIVNRIDTPIATNRNTSLQIHGGNRRVQVTLIIGCCV